MAILSSLKLLILKSAGSRPLFIYYCFSSNWNASTTIRNTQIDRMIDRKIGREIEEKLAPTL